MALIQAAGQARAAKEGHASGGCEAEQAMEESGWRLSIL